MEIRRIRDVPLLGLFLIAAAMMLLVPGQARAQLVCPVTEVASGLLQPLGMVQTSLGNLIVAESGTLAPNTGRLSIVGPVGQRRTLVAGLPSGINDVGGPSGPAGLFTRGRTLYVVIGSGDTVRAGPLAGTTIPNPDPPASPLFSSVLRIHFSAHVEQTTNGFTLSVSDHLALASGEDVTISYGGGETLTIQMVAAFPDYVASPLPFFPANVRHSNPFQLTGAGDQLYVTDGGQNHVWQVDVPTRTFSVLAAFPPIPNPAFPFGPPVLDSVPTGITYAGGQLLVTLFRGFPFPPGTSTVEQVDPQTGSHAPFIIGLKTAIDVLHIRELGVPAYLVVEHISGPPGPPQLGGPGRLLSFGDSPSVVADCLNHPTTMSRDEQTGTVYVAELGGRIVAVRMGQ